MRGGTTVRRGSFLLERERIGEGKRGRYGEVRGTRRSRKLPDDSSPAAGLLGIVARVRAAEVEEEKENRQDIMRVFHMSHCLSYRWFGPLPTWISPSLLSTIDYHGSTV